MKKVTLEIDKFLSQAARAEDDERFSDAEYFARKAILVDSECIGGLLILGSVSAKLGKLGFGKSQFYKVLSLDPDSYDAIVGIAEITSVERQSGEAFALCREAIRLCPTRARAYNVLGQCFIRDRRQEEAIPMFQKAIELDPQYAIAYHNLAACMERLGRDEEAEAGFLAAIKIDPNSPNSYASLGKLLRRQGKPAAAVEFFDKGFLVSYDSVNRLLQLSLALTAEGDYLFAEKLLKRAVEISPNDGNVHALLGRVLRHLGRFEEARLFLEVARELLPERLGIYFDLAYTRKFTSEDAEIIRIMEELLEQPNLVVEDARQLSYALGKAYDDLANYEVAIKHFDQANLLMRRQLPHGPVNAENHRANIDWLIKLFTQDWFSRYEELGSTSQVPVLIVGMIRSGTTLLDQILTSHGEIGGVGESAMLAEMAMHLIDSKGRPDVERVGEVTEKYLGFLINSFPERRRVIDKMPLNFLNLGRFHLMFPKARIIHCRRNPIDTGVSIYVTPYDSPVNYAHDREAITSFYEQYQRLMDHWRSVLPQEIFIEVNYEDIVERRDVVIPKIVEFLGLAWDPNCLRHENNLRGVQTPSNWQVRQPVYKTSIERWRNYESWLGAMSRLK